MKYAKTFPAPTTATSVADLFSATQKGCEEIIVQAPAANAANIYFGNQGSQPGFIIPGGSAVLEVKSTKNLYLLGTGGDFVIVLVVE